MSETRVLYRLERACPPCHDKDHGHCARTLYASPFEPLAPCECPTCHTVAQEVIPCDDPRYHAEMARRRRVAVATKERHGSEHYRAIGRKGGLVTLDRYGPAHYGEIGQMKGLARWALDRWKMDTSGED